MFGSWACIYISICGGTYKYQQLFEGPLNQEYLLNLEKRVGALALVMGTLYTTLHIQCLGSRLY